MEKQIPVHVVFVEAWIKKGNEFLLAKRSAKDDQAAGSWAVPGGKIEMELGDHIVEDALMREVMEEVGIEIENFRFIGSRGFVRSSGHHVVGLSFVVDYKSGEAKPLEDHEEVRWVTYEELKSLLHEDHWQKTLDVLKEY